MKLLAAIVLYKRSPEESETFVSLLKNLRACPALAAKVFLLLYDNSPEPHPVPPLDIPHTYLSDPRNLGLAHAYNHALALAAGHAAPWLMLLDQDTVLTAEYVQEVASLLDTVPPTAAAIVPRLAAQGGHIHSPHLPPHLSHRGLPAGVIGLAPAPISAFNSGAVVRTAALERIGGFPEAFPLDFLDHAVFHALQQNGFGIYIMRSILQHDLSTMKLGGPASLARYRNILAMERAFYTRVGGPDYRWYRLRRLKQTLGHLVKVRDKRFAWMDLQAALGLLRPPRNEKAATE